MYYYHHYHYTYYEAVGRRAPAGGVLGGVHDQDEAGHEPLIAHGADLANMQYVNRLIYIYIYSIYIYI